MAQQTTASINEVKDWVLAKHTERQDIGADEDLIETRLVDSLSFVEFIFVIEQASGTEIDMDTLDLDDLRTLAAIEKRFFAG
ncbi:MAG: acyl carrier protein [Pseudonocardiales bacterium]|nr:acyl carrier protein [Pseudonocardiales bacterium]MBV9728498.1 acyl carrier protein [Pseudonocardiales bacterium]